MPLTLGFEPTESGVRITAGGVDPVPIQEWAYRADAFSAAGVGILMRLRDNGEAEELGEHTLFLAWKTVARLSESRLESIGLPPPCPFLIEISCKGALSDPDVEVTWHVVHQDRRLAGVRRQGARIRIGGNDFTLLDPMYSVVEAVDRFPQRARAGLERKMLLWGQISEMLPPGARVHRYLRSLKIAVAPSFALSPALDAGDELTFDPILGHFQEQTDETGETRREFQPLVPEAPQEMFQRKFRRIKGVKHRYALGRGTYVVLAPDLERVLKVVRKAQKGSPKERRDFLKNVSGYVREALEADGTEGVGDVDDIFFDHGLSDRVKEIGEWSKKVLPWITQPPQPWLPPEQIGVCINDQYYELDPKRIPEAIAKVRKAISQGEEDVIFDGVALPATQETITALEALERRSAPDDTDHAAPMPADLVLVIKENLEIIEYERKQQGQRNPLFSSVNPPKAAEPGNGRTPALLDTTPMPHQEEGLIWLEQHWQAGTTGALLADDMGLGKTLIALAFLAGVQAQADSDNRRPILIVVPTGLLANWKEEHDKHLAGKGLGFLAEAHGTGLRRLKQSPGGAVRGELKGGKPLLDEQFIRHSDWVLTTYETLRDYQHSFGRIQWAAAVFDEAQKIKNPAAKMTDAALAMNIGFALMMTGTPVENRPADIWSIIDRAQPGRLGTLKTFSRRYEADDAGEGLSHLSDDLYGRSDKPGPPLMLRRLKADHIPDLPEQKVHRYVVDMPKRQADAYESIITQRSIDDRGNMLQLIQLLRSVSLHPFHYARMTIDDYISCSARLSKTFEILEKIGQREEKALVFVESLEMQDFLVVALRQRFGLGDDVLVVNGKVAGKIRQKRVNVFQERKGFDVMLLSPRAGGVGLTLTAANHVIHLSRWWNPAVEDQCTDRVFRIGQSRTVHVHIPMAHHPGLGAYSFDLRLDELLKGKRAVNQRILAPTAASRQDLKVLFEDTIERARTRISRDQSPDARWV